MARSIKRPSPATRKLNQKNRASRLRRKHASNSLFTLIKNEGIDALVVGGNKDVKVYTEKTSDKVYRILIEKMHEGATVLNRAGIILHCNSFFAKMVSMPLQKVIGSKCRDYIDNSSIDQFDASIRKGWQGPDQSEIAIRNLNGRAIPALMSVNALSHNNRVMLSVILTDLTLRNRNQEELLREKNKLLLANKELENANKDLTVFTYISSHDLQEPLRKIQNFVTLIADDVGTTMSDFGRTYFEKCRAAANRMQNLIEDLLTYSHAKNIDRDFERVDLNLIVNSVKTDIEQAINDTKAVITTQLGEATILRIQFGQVMQNLIGNSLKFAHANDPPQIRIESEVIDRDRVKNQTPDIYHRLEESAEHHGELSPRKSYCHITYTDNGIGFDPQYKDRMFEVFQRLHPRDKYKGTGMGLAICKRIIENHHGVITASSQPDKGARFDIYIPAKNGAEKMPALD